MSARAKGGGNRGLLRGICGVLKSWRGIRRFAEDQRATKTRWAAFLREPAAFRTNRTRREERHRVLYGAHDLRCEPALIIDKVTTFGAGAWRGEPEYIGDRRATRQLQYFGREGWRIRDVMQILHAINVANHAEHNTPRHLRSGTGTEGHNLLLRRASFDALEVAIVDDQADPDRPRQFELLRGTDKTFWIVCFRNSRRRTKRGGGSCFDEVFE